MGYGLDVGGIGVRFSAGAREFSLLQDVRTNSMVRLASIQLVLGAVSPGVKLPGFENNHWPSSSAEVKNGGAKLPFPHYISWHDA
jgi:hypothetical protein